MNWSEMSTIELAIVSVLTVLAIMAAFVAILTGFAYWWDRFDNFRSEDLYVDRQPDTQFYGAPKTYRDVQPDADGWQYIAKDKNGNPYLVDDAAAANYSPITEHEKPVIWTVTNAMDNSAA